jgi:starch phosphorylase
MSIPACGVTLVYNGATFDQVIHANGTQEFREANWQKSDQLTKLSERIEIEIMNTRVLVSAWRYDIVGISGFVVPVFLLDTDFAENPEWVRGITSALYDSAPHMRICQEIILGIGGVSMVHALGFSPQTYHLNEGHCAFVPLALLPAYSYKDDDVRARCVFTTHTPVPEGHDRFSWDEAYRYAEKYLPWHIKDLASSDCLNMTQLALSLCHKSFAVSLKHKETAQSMFPGRTIDHVTNGVHTRSWISSPMQDLFTQYLPGWIDDPSLLRWAEDKLPSDALWSAHRESKRQLISYVNARLTSGMNEEDRLNPLKEELFDISTLTISLARRPVAYKRPLLLYSDLHRFMRIGVGKIQIIQCGKSHPHDDVSQGYVKEILRLSKKLRALLKIVYLENYSPKIARLLVAGSDIWLNTPRRPLEASGTSGMKAAMNGILNFSVLDGWYLEGHSMAPEGGFSIGPTSGEPQDTEDANDLYEKLETQIIPMYYDHRTEWINRMKKAITLGAYFNTNRVVKEYLQQGWIAS